MSESRSEIISDIDTNTVEKDTIELGDEDDIMLSTRACQPSTSAPELPSSTTVSDPATEEEDSIENEILPSREECQTLTEQFAEVTGTDTALAQFFLQDRQWNLEKSVNAYFESRKGGVKVLNDGEQPELVVTFDSKMVSALEEGAEVSTVAPTRFRLLTWNIDGLEQSNLKKRTKAIIKIIESERADVVFIQEMVPVVYSYMEERLPHFMFIAAGSEEYFTTMLLRRTSVYFDGHELLPFPGSCMGRNLLAVEAHIGACQLLLMTSHLESTADFTEERKRQLQTGFKKMNAAASHVNVIFAGDLNLRDKEVAAVGLPAGVVDVWEATGRRREVQYTWDLTRNTNKDLGGAYKPRCRFDRVYLKRGVGNSPDASSPTVAGGGAAPMRSPSVAVPRHFGLVGLQKVMGTQSFPSDHWGLMTHYDIVHASSS